jgi:NAD(P)-dependent dehydrogenase (short-subunit alcohol dehydrogenase family)
MRDFGGKTAFVTGAASGINFALARAFLAEGMSVMLAAEPREWLDRRHARRRHARIMAAFDDLDRHLKKQGPPTA